MFAVTSGECGECGGGGPFTADEVSSMDFPPFHINCGCSVESWTEEEAKQTPTQTLLYSSQLEDFVKGWEDCYLTSYDAKPGTGDWTIGWGHKLSEYNGNNERFLNSRR